MHVVASRTIKQFRHERFVVEYFRLWCVSLEWCLGNRWIYVDGSEAHTKRYVNLFIGDWIVFILLYVWDLGHNTNIKLTHKHYFSSLIPRFWYQIGQYHIEWDKPRNFLFTLKLLNLQFAVKIYENFLGKVAKIFNEKVVK